MSTSVIDRALQAHENRVKANERAAALEAKKKRNIKQKFFDKHFPLYRQRLDEIMGEVLDWKMVDIDSMYGDSMYGVDHKGLVSYIIIEYGNRREDKIRLRLRGQGSFYLIFWDGANPGSNNSINSLADIGKFLSTQKRYFNAGGT